MTTPQPKATDSGRRSARVTCAKCGHLSGPGKGACEACGAHLYIVCHACNHRNVRAARTCQECGQRLHRSRWRRTAKKLFGQRRNLTALQIALLVVSVWVAYRIIVFLVEYQPPAPE